MAKFLLIQAKLQPPRAMASQFSTHGVCALAVVAMKSRSPRSRSDEVSKRISSVALSTAKSHSPSAEKLLARWRPRDGL
jgi:hypothetical protein